MSNITDTQTNSISIKHFAYHGHTILENASMHFESGTINALIGANGCGKSTFLSIVTKERKAVGFTMDFKGNLGYVPQDNPLLNESSGYDNLLLWYKGSKKELDKELDSPLINMLGIKEYIKKPVKKMSGGMKKRISIAIALINKPDLLILDEPSSALDLICKKDIRDYLLEYKKSGGTVIITTHDEEELAICDNIFLIKNKTIVKMNEKLTGDELVKAIS